MGLVMVANHEARVELFVSPSCDQVPEARPLIGRDGGEAAAGGAGFGEDQAGSRTPGGSDIGDGRYGVHVCVTSSEKFLGGIFRESGKAENQLGRAG